MQATHIKPLTGIRFFAAGWVVLDHFHPWIIMLCPFLRVFDSFMMLGYEAVPFFFILSGFILSHNYMPQFSLTQHPRFIFLRFARLWPVHFACLFLLILNPNILKIAGDLPKSLAEEILMVRGWFHSDVAWNAPAWSISAEWFAYICLFPLAFLLFRWIRSVPALMVLVVFFLAAQASPLNSFLFPDTNRCGAIFFLFLAGCGLYQLRCRMTKIPAEKLVNAGILLLIAYVIFSKSLTAFILYTAFACLILGLSGERGWLARMLSTRWIVYGGLASYSLYMTHYLIMQRYIYYSGDYWDRIPKLPLIIRVGILLAMGAIFIGTAVLFYRGIEEPANRKLRDLFNRKKANIVAAPVGVAPECNLAGTIR